MTQPRPSTRARPPAAVVMSPKGSLTQKLNGAVARTWNAGRRLAKAARRPGEAQDDLDFNALSAGLQALLSHARRRGLTDTQIALALGAAAGPMAASFDAHERGQWVDRLASVIHASARMTEMANAAVAGERPSWSADADG